MSSVLKEIHVRFAPSPTGELHIGGARTALFNYLLTKKNKGKFFLRVEDTDINRLVKGADKRIIEALNWLGLKFDGRPIYQSKRLNIYKKLVEKLVVEGKAYWCHCSQERLEKLRQEQIEQKLAPKYDGFCREKKLGPKEGGVVRLKMPLQGETIVNDLIHGQIIFKNELLDDQVLLKSDGYPTYHLANVIDDHQMQITHVMRSDEWLPSTPKHLVLYQSFGWQPPEFAHLPMILGPDKSKLSKRHGATSILEYRKQGYLSETLINFMVLLGWNPGTEEEIFTLKDLEKKFSLERVGESGAIFNIERLNWLNGYYIRQMKIKDLAIKCIPYLENLYGGDLLKKFGKNKIQKIVALEQERMKKLSEIEEKTKYFFVEKIDYDPEILKWKNMTDKETKESLKILCDIIEGIPDKQFETEIIKRAIMPQAEATGDRGGFLWPLRAALTGLRASPDPFNIMEILGKKKALKRLKEACEKIL